MTAVSGTVYDSGGAPAVGRSVRAYRRDTGALLGSAVTTDGEAIPGDPSFSLVQLLLPMASNFNDAGPQSRAVTISAGTPTIESGKGDFDPGDFLQVSDVADIRFGSSDWCVEGYFTPEVGGGGFAAFYRKGENTSGGIQLCVRTDGVTIRQNGTSDTSASVTISSETHVAFVCQDGTIRCYTGGVQQFTVARGVSFTSDDTLYIGAASSNSSFSFRGQIRGFRVTIGENRYPDGTTFTPPSLPLLGAAVPATDPGSYTVDTGAYTDEVQVVCLDDDAGTLENDLILRTFPV